MAAYTASHRTIKGILKKKGSAANAVLSTADLAGTPGPSSGAGAGAGAGSGEEFSKKSQKWDEMSILATYHPVGKDYGLMNIDEPNTPYHSMIGDTEEDYVSDSEIPQAMSPEFLARRLAVAQGTEPKFLGRWNENSEDEDDLRRQFELKRKLHYNEGLNIKFARQLIAKEILGDLEEETLQDQEMQEETSKTEIIETQAAQRERPAEDREEDYDISKL